MPTGTLQQEFDSISTQKQTGSRHSMRTGRRESDERENACGRFTLTHVSSIRAPRLLALPPCVSWSWWFSGLVVVMVGVSGTVSPLGATTILQLLGMELTLTTPAAVSASLSFAA